MQLQLFNLKKDNGGYALVLAVFIVAIFALLVTNFLAADMANLKIVKGVKGKNQSVYAAESGYNLLLWNYYQDNNYFTANPSGSNISLPYNIGQYSYTITKQGNDYLLTVIGQSQNTQATVNANLTPGNGNGNGNGNNGNNGNHYGDGNGNGNGGNGNNGDSGNHAGGGNNGSGGGNGGGTGNGNTLTVTDWHEF